jgi:hypothetical protein
MSGDPASILIYRVWCGVPSLDDQLAVGLVAWSETDRRASLTCGIREGRPLRVGVLRSNKVDLRAVAIGELADLFRAKWASLSG